MLVEVGDLQPHSVAHGALPGSQLFEQEAQEGGLAAAVGPEDADSVASHDEGGEAPHHGRGAVPELEVAGFDHQATGTLRFLYAQAHAAGGLAPGPLLGPHVEHGPHAALVAGAAGLDALADEDLLALEEPVEALGLRHLAGQLRAAALQVGGVVAGPRAEAAPLELDDAGGQPLEEGAVVGDEEEGALEAQEEVLQPVDGVQVEVVGGLVQQQDVGMAGQGPGQQDAALHAAREGAEVGAGLQLQAGEDGLYLVPDASLASADAGSHQMEGRPLQSRRDLLGQAGDAHVLLKVDVAGVRGQLSAHELHEGGLAGAVAAEQTDALALVQVQLDAVQERRTAEAEAHIADAQ